MTRIETPLVSTPAASLPDSSGNEALRARRTQPFGPGWDALVRLAMELGDGNIDRGLTSVVGIVMNVVSGAALDTSSPWVRTLAATQSKLRTDEDILAAFRIDGSQLPNLVDFRNALVHGLAGIPLHGICEDDVIEAEWLLRKMGISSALTDQYLNHRARKAVVRAA